MNTMANDNISIFLKTMHFKKKAFNGVDEDDVLEKIEKLNSLYQEQFSGQNSDSDSLVATQKVQLIEKDEKIAELIQKRAVDRNNNEMLQKQVDELNAQIEQAKESSAAYDERVAAFSQTISDAKIYADDIVLKARDEKELLLSEARKNADRIISEAKVKAAAIKINANNQIKTVNEVKSQTVSTLSDVMNTIKGLLEDVNSTGNGKVQNPDGSNMMDLDAEMETFKRSAFR